MRICFWGTRGSIPAPGAGTLKYGGNTCCLEIELLNGKKVVVDAGTGIRELGNSLVKNGHQQILLLITHIHWDHLQGFPFFLPAYLPDYDILVDGFPTCMKGLRFIFQNKMLDGVFPVTFEELKARITYLGNLEKGEAEYFGLRVSPIHLHHPQGGYGFRFQEGDSIVTFLTDNELVEEGWKGRELKQYVRFVKGSKVLIHDAQYTYQEYQSRKGWGHSHYLTALKLAQEAEVEELVLFHHDPSRTDQELDNILAELQADSKGNPVKISVAAEGRIIQV